MNTIHLQTKETITSATAATGVDISASTYGFSTANPPNEVIRVRVYGLDAGDAAVIQIDDSVNAFTNYVTHRAWTAIGPIGATSAQGDTDSGEGGSGAFPVNPVDFSVSWRDVPEIRWGVSSAVLRVNVSSLTGTSPHLTYEAWFTY
jgi:hypothetical protein